MTNYEKNRNSFVSILIPTYNRPEYYKIALESACAQTYENIEIIVCDNSTDDRTEKIMNLYEKDKRIRYFRNKEAKTKQENFRPFEKLAQGEFLQWLMDDDVLEPNKIERMIKGFQQYPDITLATSNRRWIDGNGNAINYSPQFDFGDNVDYAIIEGKKMGNNILLNVSNRIGEPSTVLFRRNDLKNHYWNADCRGYETISDVVMWLELLEKGNCLCFQKPLSSYRRHANQEGQQFDVVLKSRLEWMSVLEEEMEKRYFLETKEEYKISLQKILFDAETSILPSVELATNKELKDSYKKFIEKIKIYINN